MRVAALTSVLALAQLCLAEIQEPLGNTNQRDSESNNPLTEAFNDRVEWALEHFHIPGIAIGVVRDGQTFAKGYGLSNISLSTPVTPHTLFFVGSTTKAHTAAAISLLVDDNDKYPHIQWDTTLYSLIPEVFALSDPWYTTHVTITDMLSHRSGLPRHDMIMMQNITSREIIERMRYLPLTAEIRTKFQYCNLMYITAAYLVETVTGQSLGDFLKERVWGVLGMNETGFDLAAAVAEGRIVSEGYFFSEIENKSISTDMVYNPALTGAGNILTSVADYNKWIAALLSRSGPISENGYNALFGAHTVASPLVNRPFASPDLYGFGWVLQTYNGERLIQHGGAQDGFGAFVLLLPERGFGFSILGNDMVGMSAASLVLGFELVDKILGIEAEKRFDWEGVIDDQMRRLKLTNETLSALYPDLPSIPDLLPHPLNLSSYTGTYTHPAYPTIRVSSGSDCPLRKVLNSPEKWTGARLCADFEDPVFLAVGSSFDIFHVSGTYWTAVFGAEGQTSATRAAFRISPEGVVSEIGIEWDSEMIKKEEKIWLQRA
ncbi:hypothetical protein BDV12DRAFT_196619 [Aspergillus spectabilis]